MLNTIHTHKIVTKNSGFKLKYWWYRVISRVHNGNMSSHQKQSIHYDGLSVHMLNLPSTTSIMINPINVGIICSAATRTAIAPPILQRIDEHKYQTRLTSFLFTCGPWLLWEVLRQEIEIPRVHQHHYINSVQLLDDEDTTVQDVPTSLRSWQTDHHHPQS